MSDPQDISPDDRKVKIKKRGRPTGVKNGMGVTKKWEPVKWKPEYEYIVALHCMGYARGVIVAKLKETRGIEYSEQHITNIINCDEAKIVKQMLINQTRKAAHDSIKSQLQDTAVLASQRIHDLLSDDQKFEDNYMGMGSLAIKFLQGTGNLMTQTTAGSVTNNQQNNVIMGGDAVNALVSALAKSNEVALLHSDVSGDSVK